jgi:hypothetical protein
MVKAKFSMLFMNYTTGHEEVWKSGSITLSFFPSALVGNDKLHTPAALALGIHWTGGWTSPRTGLNVVKGSLFLQGIEIHTLSVSSYTDIATLVSYLLTHGAEPFLRSR